MRIVFYLMIISFCLFFFVNCSKDENTHPNNSIITDDILPAADTLNSGMEYWKKTIQNNITYEEPSGWWTTLNSLAKLSGPLTVSKSLDNHTGKYAVKLESRIWGSDTNTQGLLIPGLLALGSFVNADPFIIQGKPFNSMPRKLTGYFKFTSVENDSAIVYSQLTRYNNSKGHLDTVAEAKYVFKNNIDSYQLIEINFDYYSNLVPDTLRLLFVSSGGGEKFEGKPGNTLFIDDIHFIY